MKFTLLPAAAACLLAGCGNRPSSQSPVSEAKQSPAPVRILQFYPSSTTVAPGQPVLLCYGVENAKSVRLEPPVEQIAPSLTRCIQHAPKATAEYKLIATGADGTEVSKSFKVDVAGAAPAAKKTLIVSFAASARSVPAGQQVTLCYQTTNTRSVTLKPNPAGRPLGPKGCVSQPVNKSTEFTLTAQGTDGTQDHESLTVGVQ